MGDGKILPPIILSSPLSRGACLQQMGNIEGEAAAHEGPYSPTCGKWVSAERKLIACGLFLHTVKENWFHMRRGCLEKCPVTCRANIALCPAALTDRSWTLWLCPHSLTSSDPRANYHLPRPTSQKIHMHFRRGTVYLTKLFSDTIIIF